MALRSRPKSGYRPWRPASEPGPRQMGGVPARLLLVWSAMAFPRAFLLSGWLPWSFSVFTFLWAARLLLRNFQGGGSWVSVSQERVSLRRVAQLFQELEEMLGSGMVPPNEKWESLRLLPPPWGSLAFESVRELRSRGAAVLPTLKRLRLLADHHAEVLSEARAKSAQALGQVLTCAFLVPVFGVALYLLLPGVAERPGQWTLACLIAMTFSGVGALWLLAMTKMARWAGLSPAQRPWILAAQCTGERVLALVRSGNPPDLAWTRGCELLSGEAPELALRWGYSIFESVKNVEDDGTGSSAKILMEAGFSLRKAIQVSLMEGRPCTERVESILHGLRQELKARVDRELGLLGTRALKPLFVFVAPSIFALLGFGMWLMWQGTGFRL